MSRFEAYAQVSAVLEGEVSGPSTYAYDGYGIVSAIQALTTAETIAFVVTVKDGRGFTTDRVSIRR